MSHVVVQLDKAAGDRGNERVAAPILEAQGERKQSVANWSLHFAVQLALPYDCSNPLPSQLAGVMHGVAVVGVVEVGRAVSAELVPTKTYL